VVADELHKNTFTTCAYTELLTYMVVTTMIYTYVVALTWWSQLWFDHLSTPIQLQLTTMTTRHYDSKPICVWAAAVRHV